MQDKRPAPNTWTLQGRLLHTPKRCQAEIIENALITIDAQGEIQELLAPESPLADQRRAQAQARGTLATLDDGHILLPGLIDLHIHAPQFPQLGKALELPLEQWLHTYTFPLEAKFHDLAFAKDVYQRLVACLLAQGTTTGVYYATLHNPSSLALAQICRKLGQRAFVGRVAMDNPDLCPAFYRDPSPQSAIDATAQFVTDVRALEDGNPTPLVQPIITPRFIPSCSDALLKGLARIAQDHDCAVQTHCSESDWEHNFVLERCGASDTISLQRLGLLKAKTLLAHCTFIDRHDQHHIAQAQAGIAHCPISNAYFSDAVFPLRQALDAELHVGLGTDISGGYSPSILDNARAAITAARMLENGVAPYPPENRQKIPGARISATEAFWVATAGGAQALDIPSGIFAPGKIFDALVVNLEKNTRCSSLSGERDTPEDLVQEIIFSLNRDDIISVYVAGKMVHGKNIPISPRERAT